MTRACPASGPDTAVCARVAPAWWRRGSPRRLRVDVRGGWHVQGADGRWLHVRPDRFAFGPGGLWLTVGGPLVGRAARRASATVWACSVTPEQWRRLRVCANWWMQRAALQREPRAGRRSHGARKAAP